MNEAGRESRELRQRWSGPDGQRRASQVLESLRRRESVRDLSFGEHRGRLDLRGLSIVPNVVTTSRPAGPYSVTKARGFADLRSVALEDLDLAFSDMQHLRVFGGEIANCVFDYSQLRDLRLWGVTVSRTSFREADMREAVLGGWLEGKGCTYRNAVFEGADLRGIPTPSTEFEDCNFGRAKLDKVEFDSDFVRCRFVGLLREVIFHAAHPTGAKRHPNRLVDVDFGEAEFRWVEFRGFDLNQVVLPRTGNLMVVETNFRCVLETALDILETSRGDPSLRAVLALTLRTAGASQSRGVLNLDDLQDIVTDGRTLPAEVLGEAMRRCGLPAST